MGRAKDIGFSVEECWDDFDEIIIKPDFDSFSFEDIYSLYKKAKETSGKGRKPGRKKR